VFATRLYSKNFFRRFDYNDCNLVICQLNSPTIDDNKLTEQFIGEANQRKRVARVEIKNHRKSLKRFFSSAEDQDSWESDMPTTHTHIMDNDDTNSDTGRTRSKRQRRRSGWLQHFNCDDHDDDDNNNDYDHDDDDDDDDDDYNDDDYSDDDDDDDYSDDDDDDDQDAQKHSNSTVITLMNNFNFNLTFILILEINKCVYVIISDC
jgi:hypothetical protein